MLDATRWDTALMRRYYEQAGPGYNACPSNGRMGGDFGSFNFLHALRDSRLDNRPLSLYVHLPFCASVCYHCTSNKVITKDRGRAQPYLQRLEKEIELIARHIGPDQRVEQLHLGGGTPSFLSHAELRQLMASLRRHFNLHNDDSGDYSIELDPREADWSTLGLLRELGFNHISLGVHSLDPLVQHAVNRMHTLEQSSTLVEAARTLQYKSLGITLLYGLPRQTLERFANSLADIISLQPDRLSLIGYSHQPERFMVQRRIDVNELPTPDDKLALLQRGMEQLNRAGYRHIGLEHFALADDELAMAQEDGTLHHGINGFTTHGRCDLIGLGVSAISQVGDTCSQNSSDITLYQQRLDQDRLATQRGMHGTVEDRLRRTIEQRLLCDSELIYAPLERHFGISVRQHFDAAWPRLEEMARHGLIQLSDEHLAILPSGRLLARAVYQAFEADKRTKRLAFRAI